MFEFRPIPIGTVRGMSLRLHPSMVLVLGWVLFSWDAARGGSVGSILYGALLVAAVFGCVLLHEIGHGMMAREYGIAVQDITLFPFGGIARIEGMPDSPRTESAISLAGPLTNLALAMLVLPIVFIASVLDGVRSPGDFSVYNPASPSVVGFFFYLLLANVFLAIFNLLPAFPLDGGRILRSSLSGFIGRRDATALAAGFGGAIAVILVAAGFRTGEFLLPLVALFIVITALAEYRSVQIEESLQRLTVGQFSVWERGGISPRQPLAVALAEGPHDIVVTDGGRVLGIVRKRDAVRAMNNGRRHTRIGELMDTTVVSVDASISIHAAHTLMRANNQWTLPVTEHGLYRGMFTADRLVHVHRYVRAQTPENRGLAFFSGSLSHALKAIGR